MTDPPEKVICATRYTVVVEERLNLVTPVLLTSFEPVVKVTEVLAIPPAGHVGVVAETVLMPEIIFTGAAPAPTLNRIEPNKSQSPAVRETEVALKFVAVVIDVPEVVFEIISPTLPAFALSFVVVPTIPAVLDGVIVLVAWRVVNLPEAAVVPPIAPGDANVAPPSVAAFTAVLQVNPVFMVQFRALVAVLQLGIATAVGLAVDAVAFANTVLAACVARSVVVTRPVAVKALVADSVVA
ncbi:hypothetical protein [Paraburkholderia dilworthii]|uniref:hypothetical protein n=1 Tax=Paraburkholderia dilworthii TaxID=948106 RepID=UPI000487AF0C|nr:hypothetical protein [Paraburkholderia dilworthii]